MANIGHNPTVNFSDDIRMEVNIFNFDSDIYDQKLDVIFIERIRDEHRFNNLEELKKQLKIDKAACLELAGDMNYTK